MNPQLDTIDLQILDLLQEDSRITIKKCRKF